MAGMKDEREAFEAELCRPPHIARMLEHAGRYVQWLDRTDKEALLADALTYMFDGRAQIKETQNILTLWVKALDHAAQRRPRWKIWFGGYRTKWIKGTRLGRE